MALTLNNLCGFETGGLEEAVSINNAPSTQEVVVRTGDYSLLTRAAQADQFDLRIIGGDSSDAGNKYVVGFAVQFEDLGPGTFFEVYDSVGRCLFLKVTAAGAIEVYDAEAGLIDSSAGVFSAATWHFVEIIWEHSNAGSIDVYVDENSKVSSASEDLSDGGGMDDDAALYGLRGNLLNYDTFFDDFYCYSGASGVGDFLGDCEVFRYQANTNSDTPDAGNALDAGVWQNIGQTPTAADEAEYSGAEETGYIITDDVAVGKHYRHGPHGDANIDGTIEGAKWLHQLKRGNGSGTTHYKRFGNDGDIPAAPGTAVTLAVAYANFFAISEAAAVVPLVTEHFAQGFGKSAGGREIYCKEIWAMLLHVPPAAVVGADEMMAAIAGGGGLGAVQPYIEPVEIVGY